MPEGVVFALPTLASGDMSKDDQAALVVNQATAVIVAAYLEHRTAAMAAGESNEVDFTFLGQIIESVQSKLRSF